MPVNVITRDGHQVEVTTDNQGKLILERNVDPLPAPMARPISGKGHNLVKAALPLTQDQRDRALQLILALLLGQDDA